MRVAAHGKWTAIVAVSAICFVVAGTSAAVIGPIFGPMMTGLGWSGSRTSSLATAYTLANLGSTPLIGAVLDRFGPRLVMLCGALLASSALLLASQLNTWASLVSVFALAGVGFNAAFYLPSSVIVAEWMGDRRALGMGIVMGTMSAGAALFSALGGSWIEARGWRSTLESAALLVVLMVPVIASMVRLPQVARAHSRGSVSSSVTVRAVMSWAYVWVVLSGALFAFGMQGIYFNVVPILGRAGYSLHVASIAYGATWLISGIGSLLLGVAADRLGSRAALLAGLLCCGFGTSMLAGASYWAFGFVLLWGASVNSFGQLAPVLLVERYGASHLGTLIGIQFTTAGIAGAVSPLWIGYSYDSVGNYLPAIVVSAAAIFAAAAMIPFFGSTNHGA